MYVVTTNSVNRRIVSALLVAAVMATPANAQEFEAGAPIGSLNEAGVWQPM